MLGRFLAGQIIGQLFGQAAGGVLGDFFGWRMVFFVLAAMFAIASIALAIEFARNPVTRAADERAQNGSRGFVADYCTVLRRPVGALRACSLSFLESGIDLRRASPIVGAVPASRASD